MRIKLLKYQFTMFGPFKYTADTDTTIKLMTAFAAHGLMPTVMQTIDMTTGVQVPRISLSKPDSIQIVFGDGRIDFLEPTPPHDRTLRQFFRDVKALLVSLPEKNALLTRVAIGQEAITQDAPEKFLVSALAGLMQAAPPDSIEWSTRWASTVDYDGEKIAEIVEVGRMTGFFFSNGRQEMLNGLKYLFDISTLANDMTPRFRIDALDSVFELLAKGFEHCEQVRQIGRA